MYMHVCMAGEKERGRVRGGGGNGVKYYFINYCIYICMHACTYIHVHVHVQCTCKYNTICYRYMYMYIHVCQLVSFLPCSHTSSHSQLLTPAPEQSLFGVMGVSDWDFLCPPEEMDKSDGEEDDSKRPSLDDFDGEIAVFQVSEWSHVHACM